MLIAFVGAVASTPSWWAVLLALVIAVLELLNRFADSAKFRREMMFKLGELENTNKTQAAQIKELQEQVAEKELFGKTQRAMKHDCLGKLNQVCLIVRLYRRLHGVDAGDTIDLDKILSFSPDATPVQIGLQAP